MNTLTSSQLQLATGCTPARAELFLPFLQGAMKAYEINTPQRVSGFLSQISHESLRLEALKEDLNYSSDALLRMFGRHRISESDALRFGRRVGQSANQEAIANCLYGGEWGRKKLGNTEEGDGWRFRGRGLKQLTGRSNYAAFSAAINVDFVADPEKLVIPINAALSAGWFWKTNGLNELADLGDVPAMTKRINGGDIGLKERVALYGMAMGVFA